MASGALASIPVMVIYNPSQMACVDADTAFSNPQQQGSHSPFLSTPLPASRRKSPRAAAAAVSSRLRLAQLPVSRAGEGLGPHRQQDRTQVVVIPFVSLCLFSQSSAQWYRLPKYGVT